MVHLTNEVPAEPLRPTASSPPLCKMLSEPFTRQSCVGRVLADTPWRPRTGWIQGSAIWIPGDMMSFIAAGIAMAMWFQQEEEKQPQPIALPPTATVRKPIFMQGGGSSAQGPRERD